MASPRRPAGAAGLIVALREHGLARFPGAHLKSPWPGHLDLAVRDKTFAYLSAPGDPPSLSLKLPLSCSIALDLPGAEPTGYGLGKSGWVSLSFAEHAPPPRAQLEAWLEAGVAVPWNARIMQVGADGSVIEARPAPRFVGKPKVTELNSPCAQIDNGTDLYIAMARTHQI